MPAPIYWILVGSLLGAVLGLVVLAARKHDRRLWGVALLVAAVSVGVWYATPSPYETRGGNAQEIAGVVICYVAMLLGMMAQYVYAQAEKGAQKLTFNALTFVMPILVSPIVFIPLLTIASEVNAPGILSQARVMVYLVAFQNGFFWKGFLEQQRRARAESAPPVVQ